MYIKLLKSLSAVAAANFFLAASLSLWIIPNHSTAGEPQLVVAISSDIPPYVMEQATTGLEVDIVRAALAGYELRFIQLPYADLQSAVLNGKADVSVGVQKFEEESVFYSRNFVTFANYAISKKKAGLEIDSVDDLKHHPVLAWQDAYLELGDEFERLFSPGSPQRNNYTEVANQLDQVKQFWKSHGAVIVIDGSIFRYFSKQLGHSMSKVELHAIFPEVTNFKVGFKDGAARNAFNDGLAELCQSGQYRKLLDRYNVILHVTVCD